MHRSDRTDIRQTESGQVDNRQTENRQETRTRQEQDKRQEGRGQNPNNSDIRPQQQNIPIIQQRNNHNNIQRQQTNNRRDYQQQNISHDISGDTTCRQAYNNLEEVMRTQIGDLTQRVTQLEQEVIAIKIENNNNDQRHPYMYAAVAATAQQQQPLRNPDIQQQTVRTGQPRIVQINDISRPNNTGICLLQPPCGLQAYVTTTV